MILHINSNYIYSKLHAQMMSHMPDPEKHLVFVPSLKNPTNIVWDKDKAPKYPRVINAQCFNSFDRPFYAYKRKKIYKALKDNIDPKQIKLTHAYTLFTDGDIAYRLKKEFGIPYIVVLRNSDVNTFFRKVIHLRKHGLEIIKEAQLVFFLSPSYMDQVIGGWVPDEFKEEVRSKSRIVPNGIGDFWHENRADPVLIEERKKRDRTHVKLLYVGYINRNKNIEACQRARKVLLDRGIETRLDIVGRIINRFIYKKLMTYPATFYSPPKKEEELIDFYRKADIFVMPSKTESFGLVYAEALSQGLPVIYTRHEGFDGQFPDGQVGYAVDPDSPEEIADSIEKILKDPAMIDRALAGAENFNWRDINKRYTEIYRQLIGEN